MITSECSSSPVIRNDIGRPVCLGQVQTTDGSNRYVLYCGDSLDFYGAVALFQDANDDGKTDEHDDDEDDYDYVCSATDKDASQCMSCTRMVWGPRRGEVLRCIFPSLSAAVVSSALRLSGGSLDGAASLLASKGAIVVDPPSFALPSPEDDEDENKETAARRLVETLSLTDVEIARAALRRCADAERAAAWIADDVAAVEAAAEDDRAKRKARVEAVNAAATAPVPDAVEDLGKSPFDSVPRLADDETMPDAVPVDGHRLVRIVDLPDGHEQGESETGPREERRCCALCASHLPNRECGSYRCQSCRLCEGCVRSGIIGRTCPAQLNGGRLHCHPLFFEPELDPDDWCTVCEKRRTSTAWTCSTCKLRACADCMGRPLPPDFDRFTGRAKVSETPKDAVEEDGKDESDVAGVTAEVPEPAGRAVSDSSEYRAAERAAAAQWEGSYGGRDPITGNIIVGAGDIGRTNPPDADVIDYAAPMTRRLQYDVSAAARLEDEAKSTLEQFVSNAVTKNRRAGDSLHSSVSATDIAHVEDLLHRAGSIDDRLTGRALRDAIANGRLEIAGMLLLSRTYAPRNDAASALASDVDTDGGEHASEDAIMTCWCGDVIDSTTAPDGAVGCLGGHAMHASCAADLLLSGGSCPSCRQPLYFPRVTGREAKAALDLVKAEARQSQGEVEEGFRVSSFSEILQRNSDHVGCFVRISSDVEACKKTQIHDPRSGGWADEMATACGHVGRVIEAIKIDDELVALRVAKCSEHILKSTVVPPGRRFGYTCLRCGLKGPSPETGWQKCSRCSICEVCCHKLPAQSCGNQRSDTLHSRVWHPSLLQPVSRESKKVDLEEAAANAAEHHLARLRAELQALLAAREAIKANLERVKPPSMERKRELSSNSSAAVYDLLGKVSPADWYRGRHLLLLARQWGDSDGARATRTRLYDAVRKGELDTVARIVRRYNASRTADAIIWADAVADRCEYIVEPTAKVDLRAFPSMSAPKTGYSLDPGSHFASKREILDSNGILWLFVDDSDFADPTMFKVGTNVDVCGLDASKKKALVGARVKRGPNWDRDNQDGGEGNEGTIVSVDKSVFVKWDNDLCQYEYKAGPDTYHLIFMGGPTPPPQGWLCVRPGGPRTPAVVTRTRSPLRCFSCGDGLVPPRLGRERFSTVKGEKLHKGDRLIVAATLEPVVVESCTEEQVFCSFPKLQVADSATVVDAKLGFEENAFWYRPCDLIFPKGKDSSSVDVDEQLMVKGHLRTRREVVLLCGGDDHLAKHLWSEALKVKKSRNEGEDGDDEKISFASCARGHLLHARCLQGALLAGRCCPAPGCTEPLWVPRVRQERAEGDDTCCGNENDASEIHAVTEALRTANELAGHAELVSARNADQSGGDAGHPLESAGFGNVKMCPICCAGPLFNEHCDDMQAHHGECSAYSFGSARDDCTPEGPFRASASDIAKRLMRLSATDSVAEVLPRCPTHNVLVVFNGCMSCGHLFIDTSWDGLPAYDPKAMAVLELDKKKRKAAELLVNQIRREAAMLQFDRDTIWRMQRNEEDGRLGEEQNVMNDLPPLPPSVHKYIPRQCGPACTQRHIRDGDCVVCGRNFYEHNGHDCWDGSRGAWIVDESQARLPNRGEGDY